MEVDQFLQRLWRQYTAITPQAYRIHALLGRDNSDIFNDHVAFRTFRRPPFDIASLQPFLIKLGYRRDGFYNFPEKKLHAWSYVHDNPDLPLIFLSELLLDQLSELSRAYVERLLLEAQSRAPADASLFHAGRLWSMPSWQEYTQLEQESDYAAWLSVWGFCANHFTVSVNRLQHPSTLQGVVALLQQEGFRLNEAGGVIKGSPDTLLEQASTLADQVEVHFRDAARLRIPSCYYEFAYRYPTADGSLFRGFVPQSADKIFQSTDRAADR